MSRRSWVRATIGAALALLFIGRWLATATADRLWAEALGVGAAHDAIRDLRSTLLGVALSAAAIWCVGNLYLFYRSIGSVHVPRRVGNIEIVEAVPRRYLLLGAAALGLIIAGLTSYNSGEWWQARALLEGVAATGLADPILGRDASYYLVELPWQRTLHGFALRLAGTMTIVCTLLYMAVGAVQWTDRQLRVADLARMHIAGLLVVLGLVLFWGYRLEPAEYVGGIHEVPYDSIMVDVRIPVARFSMVLALLASAAGVLWFWMSRAVPVITAWSALMVASVVGHFLAPPFMAALRTPEGREVDVLVRDRRDFTRMAFGLATLDTALSPPAQPDVSDLSDLAPSLETVPIWDESAVTTVLNSVARIQPHYRFDDVRMSVYPTREGRQVPLYVAARRLDLEGARRSERDMSWDRVHVAPYSFAMGVVAVTAHRAGDDGLPLFVPDLAAPDSATLGLADVALDDPRIVFGPETRDFAIVSPGRRAYAGVVAGGTPRRLALAWVLQSPRLLTSPAVDDASVVLWHRAITQRLERFAPFVSFDQPQAILVGGRLQWVASGYLSGEAFPLARGVVWRGRTVRYLHASLVGVVDAHSGTTAVYLTSNPGPLAAAWARLAPDLVRPADELPPEIVTRLGYPEPWFRRQVALLADTLTAEPLARSTRFLSAVRRRSSIEQPQPVSWLGPSGGDPVSRLRLMAPLVDQGSRLTAMVHGSVREGAPRLQIERLTPPLEVASTGEVVTRLADVHSPSVGVIGALRTVVFETGVFSMQAAYATDDGVPRLRDVVVRWGGTVSRGGTLADAIRGARVASPPAVDLGPTTLTALRRWFERLDEARRVGDWSAFGRAYDRIRRLLGLTPAVAQ